MISTSHTEQSNVFPSHKSNLHTGGEGVGGKGKKKTLIANVKEKKERVQVLTSRVAHICCYLCVITPLQILIVLSESGWWTEVRLSNSDSGPKLHQSGSGVQRCFEFLKLVE